MIISENKREQKENNTFVVAGVVVEDSDLINEIGKTELTKDIEY